MPDRRRHGEDENRSPGGPRARIRPLSARSAHRLSCRAMRRSRRNFPGSSICATACRARRNFGSTHRLQRERALPRWRSDLFVRIQVAIRRGKRSHPFRRHLQPLFRARESRRRARGAFCRRLSRALRRARRRFITPALLRPHISFGRQGGRSQGEAERTIAALAPYIARGVRSWVWSQAAFSAFATKSRHC